MGRLFVAGVLLQIIRKPAEEVAEVELEPIEPGAWAAWAQAFRVEQAADTTTTSVPTTLVPAAVR